MGNYFRKLWSRLYSNKERNIIMVGLDNAGKTTILYKLKLGEIINTTPTVGFNVERIEYKNINLTVWDVGGQDKVRGLWYHYFQNCHAIIFVVDSTDKDRFVGEKENNTDNVKHELSRLSSLDELRNTLFLIFANKQDCHHAVSLQEICKTLDLYNLLKGHKWRMNSTDALSGAGLYEGLDWLTEELNKNDS